MQIQSSFITFVLFLHICWFELCLVYHQGHKSIARGEGSRHDRFSKVVLSWIFFSSCTFSQMSMWRTFYELVGRFLGLTCTFLILKYVLKSIFLIYDSIPPTLTNLLRVCSWHQNFGCCWSMILYQCCWIYWYCMQFIEGGIEKDADSGGEESEDGRQF